jgi:hypothetical protein
LPSDVFVITDLDRAPRSVQSGPHTPEDSLKKDDLSSTESVVYMRAVRRKPRGTKTENIL